MMWFIRWWIIWLLECLGLLVWWQFDFLRKTWEFDITRLSFVIIVLMILISLRTGWYSWRLFKLGTNGCSTEIRNLVIKVIKKKNENSWFVCDLVLSLGLLGTVIGFIYMLIGSFGNMDPTNVVTMRNALKEMGKGMGTALYTTAYGIIANIVLRIQLFGLDSMLKTVEQ